MTSYKLGVRRENWEAGGRLPPLRVRRMNERMASGHPYGVRRITGGAGVEEDGRRGHDPALRVRRGDGGWPMGVPTGCGDR